jgi:hypothetical protein
MKAKQLTIHFKNNSILIVALSTAFWSYIIYIFYLVADFSKPDNVTGFILITFLLSLIIIFVIVEYLLSFQDKLTISENGIVYKTQNNKLNIPITELTSVYYCYVLNEKIKPKTIGTHRYDLHPYLIIELSKLDKNLLKRIGNIRYPKISDGVIFKQLNGFDFLKSTIFINIENSNKTEIVNFFSSIGYNVESHKPLIDTDIKEVYNDIIEAYIYGEDVERFKIK